MPHAELLVPVRQAEDEEFHEGGFQQQLLVFGAKVAETRDVLGPLSDHLHGRRQQVVELLDVVGVFLLSRADFRLVVLNHTRPGFKDQATVSSNLLSWDRLLTFE